MGFVFFCCYFVWVLFSLVWFGLVFETGSHPEAQTGLELLILLLPTASKCWEYRFEPPCPAMFGFETESPKVDWP